MAANLTNGRWRTLRSLATARSHGPVAVYDHKLYVLGGGGPNFKSLDSCVVYDPAQDRWETLCNMPTRRSGSVAFTINDKIYVVGGGFKKEDGNFRFLDTVEIYDPQTDTWDTGPNMLQPHDYPAAALYRGAIYVLGGHHPEACLGGPKTDPGFAFCERLDLAKGRWERLADLTAPRFAAAGFVLDGHLYAAGGVAFRKEGFNNFDFLERYDPQNDGWTHAETVKLPWPAAGHGICVYDNRLVTFGGYSTDNIHARAAYYDGTAGAWVALPAMPLPRAAMGAAVIGRTLYLVGGWADDGRTPIDSVVAYDFPE